MATPQTCLVYVYLQDILNGIIGLSQQAQFSVTTNHPIDYGYYVLMPITKSVAFDSNGYAAIQIVETETPGAEVVFSISYRIGKTTKQVNFLPAIVPNAGAAALTSFADIAA